MAVIANKKTLKKIENRGKKYLFRDKMFIEVEEFILKGFTT